MTVETALESLLRRIIREIHTVCATTGHNAWGKRAFEDTVMSEPTTVVTLTLEELKLVLEQVVEQSVTRALAANQNDHVPDDRLVSADGAADFLGYSKDWIYRHWKKIGGRKIGAKGLRFSRHELERWAASRKQAQSS